MTRREWTEAELDTVESFLLRGAKLWQVADGMSCSQAEAQQAIALVRDKWSLEVAATAEGALEESLAQHRRVQQRAWDQYQKNEDSNFLKIVMECQDKVDELQRQLEIRRRSVVGFKYAEAGPGRPTKLTTEVQGLIVEAIRAGATYKLAAESAGMTYDSFNDWMKRGEAEMIRRSSPRVKEGTPQWLREDRFFHFSQRVKKAEAQGAVERLKRLDGNPTWQTDAWLLERRYPQDYGRQVTQMQGDEEKPVIVKVIKGVSTDDL